MRPTKVCARSVRSFCTSLRLQTPETSNVTLDRVKYFIKKAIATRVSRTPSPRCAPVPPHPQIIQSGSGEQSRDHDAPVGPIFIFVFSKCKSSAASHHPPTPTPCLPPTTQPCSSHPETFKSARITETYK